MRKFLLLAVVCLSVTQYSQAQKAQALFQRIDKSQLYDKPTLLDAYNTVVAKEYVKDPVLLKLGDAQKLLKRSQHLR